MKYITYIKNGWYAKLNSLELYPICYDMSRSFDFWEFKN